MHRLYLTPKFQAQIAERTWWCGGSFTRRRGRDFKCGHGGRNFFNLEGFSSDSARPRSLTQQACHVDFHRHFELAASDDFPDCLDFCALLMSARLQRKTNVSSVPASAKASESIESLIFFGSSSWLLFSPSFFG